MAGPEVVVRSTAAPFAQQVEVGPHRFSADEPEASGGSDAGPDPYALLLAALGSCTSMTLLMYARRKRWPLEQVVVRLRHDHVHAEDCADCEQQSAHVERIDRRIALAGPLDATQRTRLLDIANKCPVHRTLTSRIDIRSALDDAAAGADA